MKRPTPSKRTGRESPLLADVRLAIGTRRDILAERINTGVFRPLHGDQKRVIRSAPNGFPDINVTQLRRIETRQIIQPNSFQPHERFVWHYYGQRIGIETKSATGAQREAQQDYQRALEAVGGIYILARSVEDVLRVIGPEPDWLPEYWETLGGCAV
jgi:hypothetical protein